MLVTEKKWKGDGLPVKQFSGRKFMDVFKVAHREQSRRWTKDMNDSCISHFDVRSLADALLAYVGGMLSLPYVGAIL